MYWVNIGSCWAVAFQAEDKSIITTKMLLFRSKILYSVIGIVILSVNTTCRDKQIQSYSYDFHNSVCRNRYLQVREHLQFFGYLHIHPTHLDNLISGKRYFPSDCK